MSTPLVNVIIPLARNVLLNDCHDRLDNTNAIIHHWLKRQYRVNVRLILVEQSLTGKGWWFLSRVKTGTMEVVKVKASYPVFCKGWLYNIGTRHAIGQHLMFAESDVIGKASFMDDMLTFINNNNARWCVAWRGLYYTDRREQQAMINGGIVGALRNRGVVPRLGKAEGGLVYVRKDFFNALGGYNEWIIEIGGPDNDLNYRARFRSHDYPTFPQKLFHLYHQRAPVKGRPTRLANLDILNEMRRHPGKICKALARHGVGGKERPACADMNWVEFLEKYA